MTSRHLPERRILSGDGIRYSACVYAQQRDDGLWVGWLELTDQDGRATPTDAATVQPTCEGVASWASELTLDEIEEALERTRESRHADDGPTERRDRRVRSEALALGCH
jgi:hypothetical protein